MKIIEKQLFYKDGTSRDINFNFVDNIRTISFLEFVATFSKLSFVKNFENNSFSFEELKNNLSNMNKSEIISEWVGKSIISNFQIFLSWEKKTEVYIEISFYPENILNEEQWLKKFVFWLKSILLILDVKEYYVRNENVSWKYGVLDKNSGVIFSHNDIELIN